MKFFILGSVLLLASACSGSPLGHDVSSQFHAHDGAGGYSYGYSDPNSQKMEAKDAHGVTHGEYSYIDANGHLQTVKYIADPKNGFQVVGTNLPQGPAPAASHSLHKRSVYAPAPVSYVPIGHYSPVAYWDGPVHVPVIEKGVPIETPEVKHAKAAHAAAYAKVAQHEVYVPIHHEEHAAKSLPGAWHGPQHVPVIKNGVPVETPEVQHAKAVFLDALATAAVQSRSNGGHEDDGSYKPHLYQHETSWDDVVEAMKYSEIVLMASEMTPFQPTRKAQFANSPGLSAISREVFVSILHSMEGHICRNLVFAMKALIIGTVLLLASACADSGQRLASQYHAHDGVGGYSYGYTDPNSQKHESKDAHGVTRGEYSYIDANGLVQKVKYIADPKHGFRVVGTNLQKGTLPAAAVHEVAQSDTHAAAPRPHIHSRPVVPKRKDSSHHSHPVVVVLREDGVPLETPEVRHAKAAHLAAHAKAKANVAPRRPLYIPTPSYAPTIPEAVPVGPASRNGWRGPLHFPVIDRGVPLETPEVLQAKAIHAAAYAKIGRLIPSVPPKPKSAVSRPPPVDDGCYKPYLYRH
ncbi:uncharacterized protein LOC129761661 [Toxorhynchites rutilus septentrionalis]|uniref:uncharacterized protein LOC129761661 n=1 Tax=Toxorhynchites rutilus septentrionalis TaxID=329112 RepID=UPI0024793234|nr:uncharacterized protein LOC129761661 [Toxorhynchites rutilus septentrionalis]